MNYSHNSVPTLSPACFCGNIYKPKCNYVTVIVGARGVMVVVGNEHGDTSSNPGRDLLHSTNNLGNGMNPITLPPAMGK